MMFCVYLVLCFSIHSFLFLLQNYPILVVFKEVSHISNFAFIVMRRTEWIVSFGSSALVCFSAMTRASSTGTSFSFLIKLKIQRKGKRMSLEKTFRGIHIIIKAAESYGFYKDGWKKGPFREIFCWKPPITKETSYRWKYVNYDFANLLLCKGVVVGEGGCSRDGCSKPSFCPDLKREPCCGW